jgi:hypothetical protein
VIVCGLKPWLAAGRLSKARGTNPAGRGQRTVALHEIEPSNCLRPLAVTILASPPKAHLPGKGASGPSLGEGGSPVRAGPGPGDPLFDGKCRDLHHRREPALADGASAKLNSGRDLVGEVCLSGVQGSWSARLCEHSHRRERGLLGDNVEVVGAAAISPSGGTLSSSHHPRGLRECEPWLRRAGMGRRGGRRGSA